eukprot:1922600-Amphidinium_carterae.1
MLDDHATNADQLISCKEDGQDTNLAVSSKLTVLTTGCINDGRTGGAQPSLDEWLASEKEKMCVTGSVATGSEESSAPSLITSIT